MITTPTLDRRTGLLLECEWKSISGFKGARRTSENVFETYYLPLDIDVPCYLSELQIMEYETGFPKSTKLRSSVAEDGKIRVHALYELKHPAPPELHSLFKLIQEGIANMYAAFGITVDKSIIGDLTRFVRNPHGIGRKNLKYDSEPDVIMLDEGEPAGLGDMYSRLKELGFLPEQTYIRKTVPFKESFKLVRNYFRKHRITECTQSDLAERLGIKLRTLQFILKRLKGSEVDIKWVGNNKGENKRRCVFISLSSEPQQKDIKANSTVEPPSPGGTEHILLDHFKKKVVKIGERNKFVFAATLELVHLYNFQRNPDRIIDYLGDNYDIEGLGTSFSERGMQECILSALNPRYTHPINPAKLWSDNWGLLPPEKPDPYMPTRPIRYKNPMSKPLHKEKCLCH